MRARSPYLDKEFRAAKEQGVIPSDATGLGGSWSALSEAGEATNLNLVRASIFAPYGPAK